MTRNARALLLLLGIVAAACSREQEHPIFARAPVILISVDTLRADHLPVYGYRKGRTPNIDALRRDGILFESAYCHCPMTLPSHVSMFTGLLPTEHGVRNNIGYRFDAAKFRRCRSCSERGYATGAAVSSYVLRADTGLDAASISTTTPFRSRRRARRVSISAPARRR